VVADVEAQVLVLDEAPEAALVAEAVIEEAEVAGVVDLEQPEVAIEAGEVVGVDLAVGGAAAAGDQEAAAVFTEDLSQHYHKIENTLLLYCLTHT